MNLFVVSKDPDDCAKALDDRLLDEITPIVARMLLLTCHRVYNLQIPIQYTAKQHPCLTWLRRSDRNFNWTASYFMSLNEQCARRLGRPNHMYKETGPVLIRAFHQTCNTPDDAPDAFVNHAVNGTVDFSFMEDVCLAYRKYLNVYHWHRQKPVWSNIQAPEWYMPL